MPRRLRSIHLNRMQKKQVQPGIRTLFVPCVNYPISIDSLEITYEENF